MICIISPAKSVNFDEPAPTESHSLPVHLTQTRKLARVLKTFNQDELKSLMSVSDNIAALNVERFKNFKTKAGFCQ